MGNTKNSNKSKKSNKIKTANNKKKIVKTSDNKKKKTNKVIYIKEGVKTNNNFVLKKEVYIPLIIGILTLILITVAATYAYYMVTSNNISSSNSVNTNVESVGSVYLNNVNDSIYMNLSAVDMMKKTGDVAYYASTEGTKTSETFENIGTVSAIGTGTFDCDYYIKITASGTKNMYTEFQNMDDKSTGQIQLTYAGTTYDFNTSNLFTIRDHKYIYGLNSNADVDLTASLKVVNKKMIDQTDLAGSDITLTFEIEEFKCDIATNS